MKQLITLGICLLVVLGARAQRIDYDNSSKWFLGVNVGGTWSTADVNDQVGAGWGLTLGKSFNYNYGRRSVFDIRARYLGGKWYGQDFSITDSVGYTDGPLKPYMDSLGYAVNNFQTELHNLSLELVLHANGVRERTGIDPYIFGGIGLKWYQTYGDLYDQNLTGGIYDYSLLGSDISKTSLSTLVDGIYETALTGSEQDKFSFAVMPSVGFGLGYQVGKRVSLGIEHKTTFTMDDNFDGFVSDAPRAKNDWYHYTSFYMQFRFRSGGRGNGGYTGGGIGNPNNNTNNLTNCDVPLIVLRDPVANMQYQGGQLYTVRAEVTRVSGRDKITFLHNGIANNNFTYDPITGRVECQVVLAAGTNTFDFRAVNGCGNTSNSVSITYQSCTNPVITWINPPTSGTVVFNPNITLSAQLTNVNGRENIVFKHNGVITNGFVYNSVSGVFECNVNLVPGQNNFELTASNACGVEVKPENIVYQNCLNPIVSFIEPTAPNTERAVPMFTLKAKIENISNANQVQFRFNGVIQTGGTYNVNTKIYQKAVSLVEGGNTFEIIATNSCGNASAVTTVVYKRAATPVLIAPAISLTNPAACPVTVAPGNMTVTGRVERVTSANQVSITVNGQPVTSFSPVLSNNGLNFQFPLNAQATVGTYTISIVAVNQGGTSNFSCTITVQQPVEEQKITICHYPPGNNGNPQTIEIPLSAWPAHQAHGDKLGPCPEVTPDPEPEQKITICHYPPGNNGNPQTIEIPLSAWPAHQAHGDKLGPCPEVTPDPVPEQKIVICHYPPGNNGNPQTIEIPLSAWPAHQAHGDKLGPCPEVAPDPEPEQKITICHYPPGNNGNPQTIEIPLSAWPAHQAHGDKLGPCPETDNGNSGNNGNQGGNETPVDGGPQKITICHYPPGNNGNPQTIEIPLSAWKAHQAHGDKLGPCPPSDSNNGDQGNGNGLGNGSSVGDNDMITICHTPPGNSGNSQTIQIPRSAWRAHQAHGDVMGACPENDNTGGNGNSGNNGNQGGNGNSGNNGNQGGNGNSNDEQMITICHIPPGNNSNPQTIQIPLSAWPAHQAHGDQLGECPTQDQGNGNSGNNGNQGGNGNSNDEQMITICHIPPGNNSNPQTIQIPLSAWSAHQAHGDQLGECVTQNQGNGNSGNNGNQNNSGSTSGSTDNSGSGSVTTGNTSTGNGFGGTGNVGGGSTSGSTENSGSGSVTTGNTSTGNGFGGTGNVGSGNTNSGGDNTGGTQNSPTKPGGSTGDTKSQSTGSKPKPASGAVKPAAKGTSKPAAKPKPEGEKKEEPKNDVKEKPAEKPEEKEGATPTTIKGKG